MYQGRTRASSLEATSSLSSAANMNSLEKTPRKYQTEPVQAPISANEGLEAGNMSLVS